MTVDRLNPRVSADATVIRGAGSKEILVPKGRYLVWNTRPVASFEERYAQLLADIAEVEASGDVIREIELRGELSAIPIEETWRDTIDNLVTTVGKNDFLDKYLKGSAYTQTIVMGLCGAGTKAVGDTQASHAGWLEVGLANAPTYTGPRKAVTMGSAAAGSSVSPTQAFAITGSGTVAGCFINNGGSTTIDNTTGILFSAGDFTGGSKTVANLDTLNVVYTLSV